MKYRLCINLNKFFCEHCGNYIGKTQDKSEVCSKCSNQIDARSNENSFVTLPLASQLKYIIENNKEFLMQGENECAGDVKNGEFYKKLKQEGKIDNTTLTLTVNTDGVQSAKSKNVSFWPVQMIINELSVETRFKRRNKILAALWHNKRQPEMNMILLANHRADYGIT